MKRSLLSNLVCASLLVFLIGCGKEIKKKTVEQTFSLSELNSHGIEFRGGSDEFPEITVICNANKIATNFKRQESLRNLLSNINSNNISNKFIIGQKHLSYSEMDYIINQAITTLNYVDPSSTNCPIVLAQTH